MPEPQEWISWGQYEQTHRSLIDGYLAAFILRDSVTVHWSGAIVRWFGIVACIGGIEVHVAQAQDVRRRRGSPEVRTATYSYHVLQRTITGVRNLFRYDNAHSHLGHPDRHHRHQFDERGLQVEAPQHVGAANWPTLTEVIDEAYRWWLANSGLPHR